MCINMFILPACVAAAAAPTDAAELAAAAVDCVVVLADVDINKGGGGGGGGHGGGDGGGGAMSVVGEVVGDFCGEVLGVLVGQRGTAQVVSTQRISPQTTPDAFVTGQLSPASTKSAHPCTTPFGKLRVATSQRGCREGATDGEMGDADGRIEGDVDGDSVLTDGAVVGVEEGALVEGAELGVAVGTLVEGDLEGWEVGSGLGCGRDAEGDPGARSDLLR
eukprot:Hpha_TRINITY_DN15632_c0_g2::TRINITY_DN15632_c0_g2_i2::g.100286::m.100286